METPKKIITEEYKSSSIVQYREATVLYNHLGEISSLKPTEVEAQIGLWAPRC